MKRIHVPYSGKTFARFIRTNVRTNEWNDWYEWYLTSSTWPQINILIHTKRAEYLFTVSFISQKAILYYIFLWITRTLYIVLSKCTNLSPCRLTEYWLKWNKGAYKWSWRWLVLGLIQQASIRHWGPGFVHQLLGPLCALHQVSALVLGLGSAVPQDCAVCVDDVANVVLEKKSHLSDVGLLWYVMTSLIRSSWLPTLWILALRLNIR